jgi:hypothetical protein
MEEKRKWIEGFEGLYWITSTGRVISAERYDRFNRKVGGELKSHLAGSGYPFVCLFRKGKGTQRYIHRLVAKAFIPNPEGKPEVDHIDNNKRNNDVSNLRWVTHKENQNNTITRARMLEDTSRFISQKGADNPFSRKVRMYSLDGEYARTFDCLSDAAEFVGISCDGIGKVCRGERFSAGGFIWAYDGSAKRRIAPTVKKKPTNKRPIQQLSKDGKDVIAEYNSVQEAADTLGIYACNIIHCAKGDKQSKTYKGYRWRYKK